MRKLALAVMLTCLQLSVSIAHADDQLVVAKNGKGVSISIADLLLEAERYPSDTVKDTYARVENVRLIARNLLLRRGLALEGEKLGLDKKPAVAAQLRYGREKALYDARVQLLDGAPPDAATLEKLARAEYNGNPNTFRVSEAVGLSHILIGHYRKDGEQLAADLLNQIRSQGADFGTLALQYSDDAGSKAKRGDLGLIEKSLLRPEFEKVAAGLARVGEVSDVFKTDLGWHILKLTDRRAAGRKPFEEVKTELLQAVARGVVDKRRAAHLSKIEQDISIDEKAVEAVVAHYH